MIRKNLELSYADGQVHKVFSSAPFDPFKSMKKLKRYLVRSRTYHLYRKVEQQTFFSVPHYLQNGHF